MTGGGLAALLDALALNGKCTDALATGLVEFIAIDKVAHTQLTHEQFSGGLAATQQYFLNLLDRQPKESAVAISALAECVSISIAVNESAVHRRQLLEYVPRVLTLLKAVSKWVKEGSSGGESVTHLVEASAHLIAWLRATQLFAQTQSSAAVDGDEPVLPEQQSSLQWDVYNVTLSVLDVAGSISSAAGTGESSALAGMRRDSCSLLADFFAWLNNNKGASSGSSAGPPAASATSACSKGERRSNRFLTNVSARICIRYFVVRLRR